MPIHDWSKVAAGIFRDFHNAWLVELRNALNDGVLPASYDSLIDRVARNMGPVVRTLGAAGSAGGGTGRGGIAEESTALTVATTPPKVRFRFTDESVGSTLKQETIVIRHASDDRIVALVEVVSPGNKASQDALRRFVEKASEALARGYHLLVLDLIPPGPRDPRGIHDAIWSDFVGDGFEPPADKPLTLASYDAGPPATAYVEPVAVGDALTDMPLFLEPGRYVPVPLEATYQAAWRGVPRRWRDVLEPPLL